jgi:DNA-binding MarR family transcriptional regulator
MATMAETDPVTGDKAESEVLLGVLDLVERDPAFTQRSAAKELGIALGLANAYLQRCIRKGLVKVSQAPARRYAYYLTPQGFAEKSRLTASYLTYSFSFFRQARTQLADIFTTAAARGHRRLGLIGEGDLAEIATLVAAKHPVEIMGTVAAHNDLSQLAAAVAALGKVDAVIITAVNVPREIFEPVANFLAPDRIYAPELLRLRLPTKEAVR